MNKHDVFSFETSYFVFHLLAHLNKYAYNVHDIRRMLSGKQTLIRLKHCQNFEFQFSFENIFFIKFSQTCEKQSWCF